MRSVMFITSALMLSLQLVGCGGSSTTNSSTSSSAMSSSSIASSSAASSETISSSTTSASTSSQSSFSTLAAQGLTPGQLQLPPNNLGSEQLPPQ
ncbi:MAG: hypothetical protein B0W54_20235 [Cellvibrio sp. 79]|nr:MAG: hypothetical protein B0W54_20235 [Cellvibrio sp. 79]